MKKGKMQRYIPAILVLSVFLCLCMCGCGSGERVPDSYVDAENQDFLRHGIRGFPKKEPESYSFSVEHSLDESMNTDNVTVSIVLQYPYGTTTYSASGSYQYMRNNDVWNGSLHIQTPPSLSLDQAKMCTSHEGLGYSFTVSSLDLKDKTITCEYSFNASMGIGSSEHRQINGTGTFPLEELFSSVSAYKFTIEHDGEENTFYLSPDYGISRSDW